MPVGRRGEEEEEEEEEEEKEEEGVGVKRREVIKCLIIDSAIF